MVPSRLNRDATSLAAHCARFGYRRVNSDCGASRCSSEQTVRPFPILPNRDTTFTHNDVRQASAANLIEGQNISATVSGPAQYQHDDLVVAARIDLALPASSQTTLISLAGGILRVPAFMHTSLAEQARRLIMARASVLRHGIGPGANSKSVAGDRGDRGDRRDRRDRRDRGDRLSPSDTRYVCN